MFQVKTLRAGTFENYYKDNIQLQFNGDQKFIEMITKFCNYGSDYQQVLIDFANSFKFDPTQFSLISPENTYILNAIASLLNVPPIDYFGFTDYEPYIKILQGQQAKNAYDGTNKGLIDILNVVFPEFQFFIEDTGIMAIKIFLIPQGGTLDPILADLFEKGYFTPKPAGVAVEFNILDEIYFSWDTDYKVGPPQQGKWGVGVWQGVVENEILL